MGASTSTRIRRSRARLTRSCGSPRARSAARISTSTRSWARSCMPATSSATNRWASWRRSAPRSRSCARETASSSRSPQAQYGPIKVPEGPPDDRFVFLSDVLPTAWQAVEYAGLTNGNRGGTLLVLGLGPIGDMACRIAKHHGIEQVIGIDVVRERLERPRAFGVETLNLEDDDLVGAVRDRTDGRGADAVIDAVGMEAHGAPFGKLAQRLAGLLPDSIAKKMFQTAGVDRLSALNLAIELVRRGGTISIIGVYAGTKDPLNMNALFDKQIQLRMGQANVKRWVDDILPLLSDGDPLGVDGFATHRLPLEAAPDAYATFQAKQDGAVKILPQP